SKSARPASTSSLAFARAIAGRPRGQYRERETERQQRAPAGAGLERADVNLRDGRLRDAQAKAGYERRPWQDEARDGRSCKPLHSDERPCLDGDRGARGGDDRGERRDRADEAEGDRDEQIDRNADQPGAVGVLRDRAEPTADPGSFQQPDGSEREADLDGDHVEGANLDRRAADLDE